MDLVSGVFSVARLLCATGVGDGAEEGVLGTQRGRRRGAARNLEPTSRGVAVVHLLVRVPHHVDANVTLCGQEPLDDIAVLIGHRGRTIDRGDEGRLVGTDRGIGAAIVGLTAVPEDIAELVADLPEVVGGTATGCFVTDDLGVLRLNLAGVVGAVT